MYVSWKALKGRNSAFLLQRAGLLVALETQGFSHEMKPIMCTSIHVSPDVLFYGQGVLLQYTEAYAACYVVTNKVICLCPWSLVSSARVHETRKLTC